MTNEEALDAFLKDACVVYGFCGDITDCFTSSAKLDARIVVDMLFDAEGIEHNSPLREAYTGPLKALFEKYVGSGVIEITEL